jgi:hypothetical protein
MRGAARSPSLAEHQLVDRAVAGQVHDDAEHLVLLEAKP